MLREEFFHRGIELKLVLVVVKSMALVVLDHVFHFDAARLQRLDHLIAFGLVHARILRALSDEQRCLDAVGQQGG